MFMIEPARPAATGLSAEKPGADHSPRKLMFDHVNHVCQSTPKKERSFQIPRLCHQHIRPADCFLRSLEHGFDLRAFSYICARTADPHAGLCFFPCAIAQALSQRATRVVDDPISILLRRTLLLCLCPIPWLGSGNDRYFIADLHDHPSGSI